MRNLREIDVKNSIEQKKLIYPQRWLERLDSIIIYLILLIFFIFPFFIFLDPYRDKANTTCEFYFIFSISIFSVYAIYRKATERFFLTLKTHNDVQTNKKLVKKYCEKLGYVQSKNSKGSKNLYIFDATGFISMRPLDKTVRIFVFEDQNIHFTTIKDNYNWNFPVLTTHMILKYDLKKLLAMMAAANST